ncbi:MAG: hypothetical protein IPN92_20775 [Chromatiaceae bacterium]|nr:hypothetical protein [Chromatiaceae bacterium]
MPLIENGFWLCVPASERSPVIVTVNGEAVSEEDVARMITRTFAQSEQILLNDMVKQKVVQSLFAGRAMKQTHQCVLKCHPQR